jgi:pilus assembly protein Flp/PilA
MRVAHPLNYMAASRDWRGEAQSHIATRSARKAHAPGETHMELFTSRIRSFVREESGQDLIEYAMLVALIALGCVVAVTAAGGRVQEVFQRIVQDIPA